VIQPLDDPLRCPFRISVRDGRIERHGAATDSAVREFLSGESLLEKAAFVCFDAATLPLYKEAGV
jgi:hypothetical protein